MRERRLGALADRTSGLPSGAILGRPVEPGKLLGPVLSLHSETAGAATGVPVRTVAGHDTAAAFVATPLRGPRDAVLSSGTWSLLGLEVSEPFLGADAAALTSQTSEASTAQPSAAQRHGAVAVAGVPPSLGGHRYSVDYDELHSLASSAPADIALFDPDDDSLLTPGDMPARITALCRSGGQRPPGTAGEMVRSILVSLAAVQTRARAP